MEFQRIEDKIKQKYNIEKNDIYGIFLFGSRVYKTNTDYSDYDYLIINRNINNQEIKHKILNIHLYTREQYQKMLNNHKMIALEIYYYHKLYEFDFSLDTDLLKKEVLKNTEETMNKAIFNLSKNYKLGINKYFHAFRILDFAIQIIEKGEIYDYSSMNDLWVELNSNYWTEESLKERFNNLYYEKMNKLK